MKLHPQKLSKTIIFWSLLLIAVLAEMPVKLMAQTIYVDVKNTTGIEDGTAAHPFNSLEEGMFASIAGQNLLIKNGSYTPSGGTWFIKPGVKISGESKENTIIKGHIKDTTYSSLPVFLEKCTFYDFIFWRRELINGQINSESVIRNCKCRDINIGHGGGFLDGSKTELGPIPYFHIIDNEVETEIGFKHGAGAIVGENIIRNNTATTISLKHGTVSSLSSQMNPEVEYLIEQNKVSEDIQLSQGASIYLNLDSIAKDNSKIIIRNNESQSISVKSGAGYTYLINNNFIQDGFGDSSGANWTTFSGNTIVNGTISDSSGGMIDEEEDQIFENNTINYSYSGDDNPVVVSISSRSVTFKNNIITGTGRLSGIKASSGAPTNFMNNTILLDKDNSTTFDDFENTYGIRTISGYGTVTGNKIDGAFIGYYSKSGAHLFADNEIKNAFYGFYGFGNEEVRNNRFTNNVYGMVINGLRGPVSENIITDNDSIGIWLMKNVDLGGGVFDGIGRNIIKGNGYYDMKISISGLLNDTLFINNNVWDHNNIADILKYDILNESTGGQLVVDFQSIIKPPSKVSLTSPVNFAVVDSHSTDFSWAEVANADSFRLQIASDVNFGNLILDSASGANSLIIDGLQNHTSYYWRVRAENIAGEGEWSLVRKFSVTITGLVLPVSDREPLFIVYPVPVKERINFIYQLPTEQSVLIQIVNETGIEVSRFDEGLKTSGKHSAFRSTENLAGGVYICTFSIGDQIFRKKFIKL